MNLPALPRLRAWSPTVALALLVAILVVALGIRRQESPILLVAELTLCALAALSGHSPRVGGLLTLAFLGVLAVTPGSVGLSAYAALLPILSASIAGRPWLRLGLALGALGLLMLLTNRTLLPGESLTDYALFWVGWVAAAWLFGDAMRALLEKSGRRAREQLEAQRHSIARDLHDTVAHSLSLIVMRGEQARLAGTTTREDLDFMVATADQSIQDLRGMLRLLRTTDFAGSQADTWTVAALPDVLEDSVRRLREHGFTPALSVEGDLTGLSASIQETLGKVTHEATTNVLRHGAPGTRCAILLEVGADAAELVMTSVPGRPARSGPEHPPLGVVGMRERVTAMGGQFSAGLGAERWITRASLPLG